MMKSFSLNPKKKKDIEKQKKLAEEEACAEVYEEFVATFETPKSQSKLFVRGTVINPNSGQELSAQNSGKFYKPEKLEEFERKKSQPHESKNKHDSDKKSHHHSSTSSSHTSIHDKPKKGNGKKKSNLEIFKEELKMLQEEREERFRQRNNGKESSKTSNQSYKSHDDDLDTSNCGNSSSTKKTGSHDTGDPNTTNIYLGNLNPKMTETQLCDIFGRYGPLASVKIMWPRIEEERIRNRNCGFVAFMCRKDGERALKALNGKTFMDYEMRLGWGKAVPIPPTPIYIPTALHDLIMPPPLSGLPFNAQIQDEKDKELLKSYANDPQKLFHENPEAFYDLLSRTVVKVTIPQDRNLLCLIHRVVEFVVREGPPFEALLMNRELTNPQYSFLFENQSAAHIYYRWRLYSVLQGEHPSRWRTEEFRMFDGGSFWRPPPINLFQQGMPEELLPNEDELDNNFDDRRSNSSSDSSDSYHRHRHRDRENGSSKKSSKYKKRRHKESSSKSTSSSKSHQLSSKEREKFEDMLRALSPQRSKIGDMMVFCIEHADSWEEIVECITDSLCISETPLYKKIARLFLMSDILHNCSVKVSNVSNYRRGFQSKLQNIFQSFHQAYNQIEARLKAEQFKQRVMNCFRAWEDSAIYSSDFLIKLQNIFLGLAKPSSSSAAVSNPTMLKNKELASKSSFLMLNKATNADDIDGEPIIDADLDGIEMTSTNVADNQKSMEDPFKNKFKASKWETVDPDDQELPPSISQTKISSKWNKNLQDIYAADELIDDDNDVGNADQDMDDIDDDIDGKPLEDDDFMEKLVKNDKNKNTTTNSETSMLPREVLRDIELKVVKFQDELETNVRSGKKLLDLYETTSQLVEKYRKIEYKDYNNLIKELENNKIVESCDIQSNEGYHMPHSKWYAEKESSEKQQRKRLVFNAQMATII
ncbi:u2 snrnp-associated surp motif-containing protein-like protein [Dermatophagoides farinae]|uniref:U2 snrnp-associated surp motif-containing protein-like protein n=1 Tax=Dermatophagoides farinae TaxID=6954 RepID=A0A9D4P425_DERFA|nr:u2 snrnp-associated surp motif-containing protein-like protein [Dermatophagoides farinae]